MSPGVGGGGMRSYCLVGTEFLLGMVKNFWKRIVVIRPWPVWLSWLEHHSATEWLWFDSQSGYKAWVAVRSPGPGARDPWFRCVREATNQCFSLALMFPFLPSSLSKDNEKMSLDEDKKIVVRVTQHCEWT